MDEVYLNKKNYSVGVKLRLLLWKLKSFFPKQFFGGMFIAIAMTGLDQEMMQKNLLPRYLDEL